MLCGKILYFEKSKVYVSGLNNKIHLHLAESNLVHLKPHSEWLDISQKCNLYLALSWSVKLKVYGVTKRKYPLGICLII